MHTDKIIPIETYFGHIVETSTIISSYKLIVSVQSVLEEKLVA